METKQSYKINLGSNCIASINQIIKIIEKLTEKEIPILYTKQRPFDYENVIVSNNNVIFAHTLINVIC